MPMINRNFKTKQLFRQILCTNVSLSQRMIKLQQQIAANDDEEKKKQKFCVISMH